jgi:hypothetical protein
MVLVCFGLGLAWWAFFKNELNELQARSGLSPELLRFRSDLRPNCFDSNLLFLDFTFCVQIQTSMSLIKTPLVLIS